MVASVVLYPRRNSFPRLQRARTQSLTVYASPPPVPPNYVLTKQLLLNDQEKTARQLVSRQHAGRSTRHTTPGLIQATKNNSEKKKQKSAQGRVQATKVWTHSTRTPKSCKRNHNLLSHKKKEIVLAAVPRHYKAKETVSQHVNSDRKTRFNQEQQAHRVRAKKTRGKNADTAHEQIVQPPLGRRHGTRW